MSSEVTEVGTRERFYLGDISIRVIIVTCTKELLLSTYSMAGLGEFGTK